MSDPAPADALAAVSNWLTNELPGGSYILPHLHEGPFWLVPLADTNDANWQVQLLLDAFPALATRVPVLDFYDPAWPWAQVHAVPHFVYDMLLWHREENTHIVFDDAILGPFPHMPTVADLIAGLPTMLWIDKDDDYVQLHHRGELWEVVRHLMTADAASVFLALDALDGEIFASPTPEETLLATLRTVADVVTTS